MNLLPFFSGVAAACAAILGGRQLKNRVHRQELARQKQQMLDEFVRSGMVFSRSYDLGSSTLIIDELALTWVLIDHQSPLLARIRSFCAIDGCYGVRNCKLHGGVRRFNEAAMLRSGTGKSNREFYQTDTARGLEIRLKAPEEETRLYIDCLDGDLSPDWLSAILSNFKEKAQESKGDRHDTN